jgi:hypothetical protein
MVTGGQVLSMLIPTGGWVITGDEFEGIQFIECEPITKKQFTDGFAKYDGWRAKQIEDLQNAKSELLTRLGITAEEAQILLS